MKKYLMQFLMALTLTSSLLIGAAAQAKDAKLVAEWDKTLTYEYSDTGTTYQSTANDDKGMLVTTATYSAYPENQLSAMTFEYFDKKDSSKYSGDFNDLVAGLEAGEDMYVQAICGNLIVMRVYKADSSTWLYTQDEIYTYKINKKGAKLLGGPIDIPLNQTVTIFCANNKVVISVIEADDEGNQTDNYVLIYDAKLSKNTKIPGTERSDILTTSQKLNIPKYWEVDDVSYADDYSETYKKIKVYK